MKKDEKYSDDEKVLILGALLHDVGKASPAFKKEEHHVASQKFILKSLKPIDKIDIEQVSDLAGKHHDMNQSNRLLDIIIESDSLSAGSERTGCKEEETGDILDESLKSVFSLISLGSSCNTELKTGKIGS